MSPRLLHTVKWGADDDRRNSDPVGRCQRNVQLRPDTVNVYYIHSAAPFGRGVDTHFGS